MNNGDASAVESPAIVGTVRVLVAGIAVCGAEQHAMSLGLKRHTIICVRDQTALRIDNADGYDSCPFAFTLRWSHESTIAAGVSTVST